MKHKPAYHFRPDSHWINDPNGPIWFDGQYHLFYQYNPEGWEWGNLHWGHAVSDDLVHWTHLPAALAPLTTRGENYCFSGCSYERNGKLELFYTSIGSYGSGPRGHVDGAEQWIATSGDMRTWTQIANNPVLSTEGEREQGRFLTHWRDPFVFRYRGETLMAIAGCVDGWKASILLYRSIDMRRWEYLSCFFSEGIATVYECPNVVVFGDKLALIYTRFQECVEYAVGTMNPDYTLNVIRYGEVLDSKCYCATNVFEAPDGRKLMWAWLREDDRGGIITDGPWQGAIALPRELTLTGDDRLVQRVAGEVDLLHGESETAEFEAFRGRYVFRTRASAFELNATIDSAAEFCISVLGADDGTEVTRLRVLPAAKAIHIERDRSSHLSAVNRSRVSGRFGRAGDALQLRVFVDNSIVEVFLNGQWAYSARVYPTNEDGIIALEAFEGCLNGSVSIYRLS